MDVNQELKVLYSKKKNGGEEGEGGCEPELNVLYNLR